MPLNLAERADESRRWRDVAPVWTAEAIPLPVSIEEPGSERPVLALVADRWIVLHQQLQGSLAGEPATVADALAAVIREAAAGVGHYPDTVLVRHAEVARALAELLRDTPAGVEVDPAPEGLDDIGRSLIETFGGPPIWPPVGRSETWGGWGLPRSVVDDLFHAAASFYEQAPWRHMANLQAPRATLPSGREWSACVLGAGDEAYGLALYAATEDLFGSMTSESPEDAFDGLRGPMISLAFESLGSIPAAGREELARARWELAGPHAYPDLMTGNTPGAGVSREDARDLCALLRAVPRFAELHGPALVEEVLTGVPCDPIEWTDPESGAVLRYEGETVPYEWHPDAEDPGDPFRLFVSSALEQVERELGPDADPDAVVARANELLAVQFEAYHATPLAELGGLSPEQVGALLASEWDGTGAVRLNRGLPAADVEGSAVLRRVRALLELGAERDGLERTRAGYLKVAVVRDAVSRAGPDELTESYLLGLEPRRTRELDVWPVHEARVLAGLAGLMRPRKGRFALTSEGHRLVGPARSGELFALLFETSFRRFNIFYGGYIEWPELQHQLAYTLCRLVLAAAGWRSAPDLLEGVVLPLAVEHAPPSIVGPAALLESYALERLLDFGLVEVRHPSGGEPLEYRVTPLFGRFLAFDFGA